MSVTYEGGRPQYLLVVNRMRWANFTVRFKGFERRLFHSGCMSLRDPASHVQAVLIVLKRTSMCREMVMIVIDGQRIARVFRSFENIEEQHKIINMNEFDHKNN